MKKEVFNSVRSKFLSITILFFITGFLLASLIFIAAFEKLTRELFASEVGQSILEGFYDQYENKVKIEANIIEPSLESAKYSGSRENAHLPHGDIELLCLYDPNLALLTSYSEKETSDRCPSLSQRIKAARQEFHGHRLFFEMPVTVDGEVLAYYWGQAQYHSFKLLSPSYSVFFVVTFCVTLLVAMVLAAKLIARSFFPLNALYNTSKVIASNPLSEERATKFSNDEIGRVVDVFNSILDNFSRENQALISSENRFRTLAEHAPIGVYLKSQSDYEYTNARWNEITGLDAATALAFIDHIERSDKKYYEDALDLARTRNTAQVIEYRYHNEDLGRRTLMEYVSLIEDEKGRACYIGSLMDVTELKVAQLELEKLAFYDPLTLLPNRRFFKDHLELAIARAQKEKKKIAIYMADLDEFKRVNDCLGHDAGDKLLVEISTRLKKVLFEGDVVSRLGGDEFMLLLDNIEDPTRLDHASQRIVDALRVSVQEGDQSMEVAGSVGIAIFPTDSQSPEELLRYADIALYNAKGAGGNRISYYSCELDKQIKERVNLEHKLRQALAENKLQVYLQPQYSSSEYQMTWAEALLRWQDNELGFVSPEVFIPLAEETGLIFPLSEFVLDRVLELLAEKTEDLDLLGIKGIAINVSPKQFFSPGFIEKIERKIQYYQVPATALEFEITETTVMDDVHKAVELMHELRAKGFKLSIDDFGTGFSSLSSLKNFPINSLKIDKSFIQDIPGDQSDVEISCAIIAMAKNLGLAVVAEGVETLVQAEFLAKNRCEFLQGYYFAKPMPIDHLFQEPSA